MNIATFTTYIQDGLIGLFVVLMGMIKIPKIEINLWGLLAKKLGESLNREVIAKVDKLQKDFQEHVKNDEEEKARAARYRILLREADLRRGTVFTLEAFDELLRDIDWYKKFCRDHPKYENAKAVMSIDYILDTYADYMKYNKFLK